MQKPKIILKWSVAAKKIAFKYIARYTFMSVYVLCFSVLCIECILRENKPNVKCRGNILFFYVLENCLWAFVSHLKLKTMRYNMKTNNEI